MDEESIAYMISFLHILTVRNGGHLIIKNLSEFSGTSADLAFGIEPENDRVILTAKNLERSRLQ